MHIDTTPETAHWALALRTRVKRQPMTKVPVAILTPTWSLIPEMRTLHPGPFRTHPAAMTMTNSVTCSVLGGPFNLSKGNQSPEHSPIAAAGHENQNHTSEP